LNRINR